MGLGFRVSGICYLIVVSGTLMGTFLNQQEEIIQRAEQTLETLQPLQAQEALQHPMNPKRRIQTFQLRKRLYIHQIRDPTIVSGFCPYLRNR